MNPAKWQLQMLLFANPCVVGVFVPPWCLSVLTIGDGSWNTTEEVDNGSAAFTLYWCSYGVSWQLYFQLIKTTWVCVFLHSAVY